MTGFRGHPGSVPGPLAAAARRRPAPAGAGAGSCVLLLALLLAAPRAGSAQALPPPAPPALRADAVVVRLAPQAARLASARPAAPAGAGAARLRSLGLARLDATAAALGATFEREFPAETRADRSASLPARAAAANDALAAFYLVHLPPATDRATALAALRASPDVASAGPIALLPVEAVPNDSLWSREWHLHQSAGHDIGAVRAWDLQRGDSAIVVAIIDTGVLYDHPDLRRRMWTNAAERTGFAGVDDDGNGYVDDVFGWDFVALGSASEVVNGEDWADEDNDPNDFTFHGTAVAGLVGAEPDNGIGVAGTAWDVRMMALRAGYSAAPQPSGWVDMSMVAKAIVYATRNGASVMNMSFSSTLQADLEAAVELALQAGVTMAVSAGNGQPLHYLSERPEAVTVGASDSLDHVTAFSSRGTFVTLVAPGLGLATTMLTRPAGADSAARRQPSYTLGASGTSFSAPLVAGAAALLQADRHVRGQRPLTPFEIKARLAETATDISAWNPGLTGYGTGRLDVASALDDRQGSFAMPAGAPSVGCGVWLPALHSSGRYAWVTADGLLHDTEPVADAEIRSTPLSGPPQGGLAAVDRGGDRGPALFVATSAGWIDGFDCCGNRLPGWPVAIEPGSWTTHEAPALADLDGDGAAEVVWAGATGRVQAWHLDGSVVSGFPRALAPRYTPIWLALGDLDGRPGAEVAAAAPTGEVWLLRGDGSTMPGWPVSMTSPPFAPLMARLGSPPRPCLLVADARTVVAYDATGTSLFGRTPAGNQIVPPAAADLDGDGSDEIVLVRASPESVFVLDAAGQRRDAWDSGSDLEPSYETPVLLSPAQPGGAPATVVLRSLDGRLLAFSAGGVPLPGFPKFGGGELSAVMTGGASLDRAWIATGSGPDSTVLFHRGWSDALRPSDERGWRTGRGNASRTASTLVVPSLGVLDDEPPAAVTDLEASGAGTHAATLAWTVPAGGAVRYDLRWSPQPISAASFAAATPVAGVPAPGTAGTAQQFTAGGLAENAASYFALRSVDAAGNASELSNGVGVVTPASAPARVADVRLSAWTDTSVTLAWTATGDDGALGRPARYRVHAARAPLDAASFEGAPIRLDVDAHQDAGGLERATLAGTSAGARWWIALVAGDAAGLESPLSNVLSTWVGPLALRSGLSLSPRTRPSAVPVELWWQGAGAAGRRDIRLYDVAGRLVRALPLGAGTEGVTAWDGRDRDGGRVHPGLYFAVLESAGTTVKTRVVVVE